MSSNASTKNQSNNDETDRCNVIAQPVYSNENLIGFMITPSKVKDFLDQVANYQPPGELNQNSHQGGCDKPMNEVVTAISQYCWKNEKCLSPTNKCGFIIFEDISVHDAAGKTRTTSSNKIHINDESRNAQNRKSRFKTTFESDSPRFSKNSTFESLSELIRYRRIHRISSNFNNNDGEEQTFRLPKRSKTGNDSGRHSNNSSHNFIFNPKVLTFLGNSESNSPLRFQQLLNQKKTPFPPSIRENFMKLQLRTGNFPWSTGGHAVGNLPFTGDGLFHHCTSTIKRNPNPNLIEGPLNYDDYLKRYAEEKNKMTDFLLWDRLCKAENESTSKQSSRACSGSSSSQNIILNEFSHLEQLHAEMGDTSFNSFTSTKNKNYYELAETTESIRGNLIHQSLNRFQSPASSQSQCQNKKSNFQPSTHKRSKINEKDQNQIQSGKLGAENKIKFMYDSSTEEDEDTNREIIMINKTDANFNVPEKNPKNSHSTFLPMKRKCSCGVTLTKKFYYCTPPINALDLLACSHSRKCFVNEFRVGHEHFGHVTFHGEIDVMGLNLDEIVDFKLKQMTLYPNDAEEKSILPGTGLKRLATVTLFKVWPMDKSKRIFITDPTELKRINYENTLRKSCQRTNSTFISYKPELGHWTFKILQWTTKQ